MKMIPEKWIRRVWSVFLLAVAIKAKDIGYMIQRQRNE